MTKEERNNKLKHLITCMKCEVSGKSCDENCPTQYNVGSMREVIENLEEISKILEQKTSTQETGHWVKSNCYNVRGLIYECSNCNTVMFSAWNYCPNCGAKMDEELGL